jgi:hypothetical protein
MASRLKELEARLAQLEEEVRRLRRKVEGPFTDETPAERGARTIREGLASQASIDAAAEKLFQQMGITGEPPGMEKLRAMKEESDRELAAPQGKRKSAASGRPPRGARPTKAVK